MKKQGRPSLEKPKKLHYSVWLTEEQKRYIDSKIKESNLSASKFILHHLMEVPIKLPSRKILPENLIDKIRHIEKLSGLLSLVVLKTKDNEMSKNAWLESSQNLKLISKILLFECFKEFHLFEIERTMSNLFIVSKKYKNDLELLSGLPKELIVNFESIFNQIIKLDLLYKKASAEIQKRPQWLKLEHESENVHEQIKQILNILKS